MKNNATMLITRLIAHVGVAVRKYLASSLVVNLPARCRVSPHAQFAEPALFHCGVFPDTHADRNDVGVGLPSSTRKYANSCEFHRTGDLSRV